MLNSYLPATVEDSFGLPGKRKKTANKQTKNSVITMSLILLNSGWRWIKKKILPWVGDEINPVVRKMQKRKERYEYWCTREFS